MPIPHPNAILSLVLYFGVGVEEELEDVDVEDCVVDVERVVDCAREVVAVCDLSGVEEGEVDEGG